MKKTIILTGIFALIMPVTVANAMDSRPFIGLAAGLSGVDYSNTTHLGAIKLPDDFFSFGIEGGLRFGENNRIYNGGVSLNFDMTDAKKIQNINTNEKIGELRTFVMSATYDNYIRISGNKTQRIDVVLGTGLGTTNYNIDYEQTAGLADDTIWSPAFAIKAGIDFGLAKNVILSITGRTFIPTRSHYAIDTQYIFGAAIRYQF